MLRIHSITEITRLKGLVFKVCCLLLGGLLWACNQPDRRPSSSIPETFSARDAYAQARVLADSAEFDSSNRAFERAAVVFEQQQNWPRYLDCLNGIAANEKETSNIAKATETLHQVVEKGLQLLGDTSAAVAQSYAYLGEIVLRQGKVLLADSLFQLSLGIRERRFGRHHPATAESIADIGMVLLQKGDLNGALTLEEEALRIRLEGLNERPSEVAASYKYLGGLYNGMGNPDKALEFFQKSLAIYQRIKGHKHPELGRIFTNLGVMYSIRGNGQQALAVLERPGTKTSAIANIYNNIAILYFENGDYEEAISYYNNALGIFHDTIGENTPDVARVYSNIGSSFDRLGNFDQALAYYEKSRLIRVALTTPKDLSLAPVYLNLGSVYGGKGAYEKAFEYYGKVLDIHLPTTGEINPQVAICYQAMADTYFKQQKYPDAAQFYGKALRVFRQTLGKHYQEVGHIYTSLGDVAMGQHQPDSALAYYQQALVSLVPGYDGTNLYANPTPTHVISQPYLVNALAAKANALSERYNMVSHDLGDLRFALATFEFASQWIDQLRRSYKGENAKLFLSQNANKTYRDAVRTATLLYTQTRENTFLERAFTFSERMKATVLMDVIKKVSAEYAAGLPDSVATREEELKTSVAFYEKQIFDENQKGDLADRSLRRTHSHQYGPAFQGRG